MIPQTTVISNIKLPILKKEEYDIWAMEMEHYLEYIDNEVWKVIQNGNSKKRISTGKDGVVRRVLSPVTAAEIQAVEKERKAKNILLMAIDSWLSIYLYSNPNTDPNRMPLCLAKGRNANSKNNAEGMCSNKNGLIWANDMRTNPEIDNLSIDDLYNNLRVFEQEIQGASKTSSRYVRQTGIHDANEEEDSLYQHQEAGNGKRRLSGCFLTMDDGIVKLGAEHTEAEETNHALMAISSSNEKTVDSWKDSSKNLWKLINSGMSSSSKIGLGYEIKSNDEVLSYEKEMNFSVSNCTEEDSIGKLLYSRFIKTNDFKGVPHPLSGDYTP
ncbi:hypothetical protein Tco_0174680 [Tanacetum coccineum]